MADRKAVDKAARSRKLAVVFDVDNTLTPPRRPLEPTMADLLGRLTVPFFLGAGGDLRLIVEQLIEPLSSYGYRGSFDGFLCNGPTRYHIEIGDQPSVQLLREFSLRDHLGAEGFDYLLRTVGDSLDREEFRLTPPMRILGERIVDRISMINVAPIGRPTVRLSEEAHANREAFRDYDARTGFRARFLQHLTERLASLAKFDLCITLGGETSFDIVVRGNDKSFPLRTLLDEGFEHVTFVGDALFEGGNDGAVLDFIREWKGDDSCPVTAVRVQNWTETPAALTKLGVVRSP